jgi:hypothetical protein
MRCDCATQRPQGDRVDAAGCQGQGTQVQPEDDAGHLQVTLASCQPNTPSTGPIYIGIAYCLNLPARDIFDFLYAMLVL